MDKYYNSKSTQELADGLELYLKQAYIHPLYINCDCEDEGAEEAEFYLNALFLRAPDLSRDFRKKILESPVICNDYFKSRCLSFLLMSPEKYREYSIYLITMIYYRFLFFSKRCFILSVQSMIPLTIIMSRTH